MVGEGHVPPVLAALVAPVTPDQAVLLYCGQGGRVSQPLAKALRRQGWTVDVLPGGWINYRRWVQAGLEVLPRLVTFRILSSALGCEVRRGLKAIRREGHQVLDIAGLVGLQDGVLRSPEVRQPSQAWFESQVLQSIRDLDPRAPVWTGDVDSQVGDLVLPGALTDALAIAPTATLVVPMAERLRRWQEDAPALAGSLPGLVDEIGHARPAPVPVLMDRWRLLAEQRAVDPLMSSLLSDHLDPAHAEHIATKAARRHALPPLVTDSLAPNALADAVQRWMPHAAPGANGSVNE